MIMKTIVKSAIFEIAKLTKEVLEENFKQLQRASDIVRATVLDMKEPDGVMAKTDYAMSHLWASTLSQVVAGAPTADVAVRDDLVSRVMLAYMDAYGVNWRQFLLKGIGEIVDNFEVPVNQVVFVNELAEKYPWLERKVA